MGLIITSYTLKMAVEASQSGLVKSLNVLFYFSALNSLIPYSMPAYYRQKIFKATIFSNVYVVVLKVHDIFEHHLSSNNFLLGDKADSGETINRHLFALINTSYLIQELLPPLSELY